MVSQDVGHYRRMDDDLVDVNITIGGRAESSSTTMTTVGAYVVVLATVLPVCAISLTSCYIGPAAGDIGATHLLLTPEGTPGLGQRFLPQLSPDTTHAQVYLLDHTAVLKTALASVSRAPVEIDAGSIALHRGGRTLSADDPLS